MRTVQVLAGAEEASEFAVRTRSVYSILIDGSQLFRDALRPPKRLEDLRPLTPVRHHGDHVHKTKDKDSERHKERELRRTVEAERDELRARLAQAEAQLAEKARLSIAIITTDLSRRLQDKIIADLRHELLEHSRLKPSRSITFDEASSGSKRGVSALCAGCLFLLISFYTVKRWYSRHGYLAHAISALGVTLQGLCDRRSGARA